MRSDFQFSLMPTRSVLTWLAVGSVFFFALSLSKVRAASNPALVVGVQLTAETSDPTDPAAVGSPCSQAREIWKAAYQSTDLQEKIASFEEAARLCPDTAAYHYALGIVYEKANRLEDSFGAYADALNADPEFAPTHFNLAAMYRSVRQYDSAIFHLEQFIQLAADDKRFTDLVKRAQLRLADVKAEQAAHEAGKEIYNQAVEEYLASLEVKNVEPEKQEARGVRELKLLSMTTAALLDYYGTAKDDRKCEVLGKSLKLLNQMLFQERRRSRSGATDPRLVATLELLNVVLDKTPGAAEIISQMIPRFKTARTLDEIEQDIGETVLSSEHLAVSPEYPVSSTMQPEIPDIAGTYEWPSEWQKILTDGSRSSRTPAIATQNGRSITLRFTDLTENAPFTRQFGDATYSHSGYLTKIVWECEGMINDGSYHVTCRGTIHNSAFTTITTYSSGDPVLDKLMNESPVSTSSEPARTETLPQTHDVEIRILPDGNLEIYSGEHATLLRRTGP